MDIYSTNNLIAVLDDLRGRPSQNSLLEMAFPGIIEETSEEIHFDVGNKPRRISPFVSPLKEGKLVESLGFTTKTFSPAYVKDKRVFDSTRPLKRTMGEALFGSLSPQQRIQVQLAIELEDQLVMLRRRKEVMASEILRTGSVTISGEDYPTVVVNFGRHANLTINLAGGAAEWDDAGVHPVDNIETWMEMMLLLGGTVPTDIIFTPGAWRLFRADTYFRDAVDVNVRGGSSSVELAPEVRKGAFLKGMLGMTRLWLYYDWYINDAGNEVPVIPDNTVIGFSSDLDGRQCHGAIRDEELGFVPREMLPKSWIEKDPSRRILLAQSAPLVVPFRPNASFCATVT